MTKYPQCMINIPVQNGFNLSSSKTVQRVLLDVEAQLAGKGRVLLRPSGTEPMVRVMVEGADSVQVEALTKQLAAVVSQAVMNT